MPTDSRTGEFESLSPSRTGVLVYPNRVIGSCSTVFGLSLFLEINILHIRWSFLQLGHSELINGIKSLQRVVKDCIFSIDFGLRTKISEIRRSLTQSPACMDKARIKSEFTWYPDSAVND